MNHLANSLRTGALLAGLTGLLLLVGGVLGGTAGLVVSLVIGLAIASATYWLGDLVALRACGARELALGETPRLRAIATELAQRAGLPVPRLYLIDRPEPNILATGRDPEHASIAVTTGLLQLMDEAELTGVVAHELAHVRSRDTLVGSATATVAGAVGFLVQLAQLRPLVGDRDDDRAVNPVGDLLAVLLWPVAAAIVRSAVSRGREDRADAMGAALAGDPDGLARALEELAAVNGQRGLFTGPGVGRAGRRIPAPGANPAFAHLFIVNPLAGTDLAGMFRTWPPVAARVQRLRSMGLRRAA